MRQLCSQLKCNVVIKKVQVFKTEYLPEKLDTYFLLTSRGTHQILRVITHQKCRSCSSISNLVETPTTCI